MSPAGKGPRGRMLSFLLGGHLGEERPAVSVNNVSLDQVC